MFKKMKVREKSARKFRQQFNIMFQFTLDIQKKYELKNFIGYFISVLKKKPTDNQKYLIVHHNKIEIVQILV